MSIAKKPRKFNYITPLDDFETGDDTSTGSVRILPQFRRNQQPAFVNYEDARVSLSSPDSQRAGLPRPLWEPTVPSVSAISYYKGPPATSSPSSSVTSSGTVRGTAPGAAPGFAAGAVGAGAGLTPGKVSGLRNEPAAVIGTPSQLPSRTEDIQKVIDQLRGIRDSLSDMKRSPKKAAAVAAAQAQPSVDVPQQDERALQPRAKSPPKLLDASVEVGPLGVFGPEMQRLEQARQALKSANTQTEGELVPTVIPIISALANSRAVVLPGAVRKANRISKSSSSRTSRTSSSTTRSSSSSSSSDGSNSSSDSYECNNECGLPKTGFKLNLTKVLGQTKVEKTETRTEVDAPNGEVTDTARMKIEPHKYLEGVIKDLIISGAGGKKEQTEYRNRLHGLVHSRRRLYLICLIIASDLLALGFIDSRLQPSVFNVRTAVNGGRLSTMQSFLRVWDVLCLAIYTAELFAVGLLNGFLRPYPSSSCAPVLRTVVGQVNCIVLTIAWVGMGYSFRGVHALRGLQLLVLLDRFDGVKSIIVALVKSVSGMMENALLLGYFFILFGILAVDYYGGSLSRRCVLTNGDNSGATWQVLPVVDSVLGYTVPADGHVESLPALLYCNVDKDFGFHCPSHLKCMDQLQNPNYGITNFNNVGTAFLALFDLASLNNWNAVYYSLGGSESSVLTTIWLVSFVVFVSFIIVNLFVGVVVSSFAQVRQSLKRQHLRRRLGRKSVREIMNGEQRAAEDKADGEEKPKVEGPRFMWQKSVELFVRNDVMQFIVAVLVIGVTALQACRTSQTHPEVLAGFNTFNMIVWIILSFEVTLRIISCNNPVLFFRSFWNQLDVFILVVSLVGKVLRDDWWMFMAALRIVRISLQLQTSRFSELRHVLASTLKGTMLLLSVLVFVLFFMVVYALAGVHFFGGKRVEGAPSRFNMETFAQAMLALLQIITGDNWSNQLYQSLTIDGYAVKVAAVFYYMSFYVGSTYILLNILTAFAVENFELSGKQKSLVREQVKQRLGLKTVAVIEDKSPKNSADPPMVSARPNLASLTSRVQKKVQALNAFQLTARSAAPSLTARALLTARGDGGEKSTSLSETSSEVPDSARGPPSARGQPTFKSAVLAMTALRKGFNLKAFGDRRASVPAVDELAELARDGSESSDSGTDMPEPSAIQPLPVKPSLKNFKISTIIAAKKADAQKADATPADKEREDSDDDEPPPQLAQRISFRLDPAEEKGKRALQIAEFVEGEVRNPIVEETAPGQDDASQTAVEIAEPARQDFLSRARAEMEKRRNFSLYFFPPESRARRVCHSISISPAFELFVSLSIIASAVILTFEPPREAFPRVQPQAGIIIKITDILAACIFLTETVVKCIDQGVLIEERHPKRHHHNHGSGHDAARLPYLRNNWHKVDVILLVCQLVAFIVPTAKPLKLLRAFRPLRLAAKVQELRHILSALVDSLRAVFTVGLAFLFMFFFFGLIAVNLFAGELDYCTDDVNVKGQCVATSAAGSFVLAPRAWLKPAASYDTVYYAMLTLFEIASLSGWSDFVSQGMDTRGVGLQPKPNSSPLAIVFFGLLTFVCSFYIVAIFVSVIINHMKAQTGIDLLNSQQRMWNALKKQFKLMKPKRIRPMPQNAFSRLAYMIVEHPHYSSLSGGPNISQLRKDERLPRQSTLEGGGASRMAGRVNEKRRSQELTIDKFMQFITIANTAVLCTRYTGMPRSQEFIFTTVNNVVVGIYVIEALLKILAWGLRQYFMDRWNVFDFTVTIFSVAGALGQSFYNTPPFRIFRVLRVLRIVKDTKRLQFLFHTLLVTLPSLLRVVTLMLTLMFIYCLIGVAFFSHIRYSTSINYNANFRNFRAGFIIMLRLLTLDDWNGLMHDTLVTPEHGRCTQIDVQDDCGSPFAYVFYLTFFIIGAYVFLNLVLAIILSHFSNFDDYKMTISERDLDFYLDTWQILDPMGRGHIPRHQVRLFMVLLNESNNPLGKCLHPIVNSMRFRAVLLQVDATVHARLYRQRIQRQRFKTFSGRFGLRRKSGAFLPQSKDEDEDEKSLEANRVHFSELLHVIGRAAVGDSALSFEEQVDARRRRHALRMYIARRILRAFAIRLWALKQIEREFDAETCAKLKKIRRDMSEHKARVFKQQVRLVHSDMRKHVRELLMEEVQANFYDADELQPLVILKSDAFTEITQLTNFCSTTLLEHMPPAISCYGQ